MIKDFCLVALGGAFGASARYGVTMLLARFTSAAWPIGTFCVNILGCLLMGMLIGHIGQKHPALSLTLGTGLLGGFTTLSAVSLETVSLIERKAFLMAALYGFGTLLFGVTACLFGGFLVRRVF